jgi:hypothetical protein
MARQSRFLDRPADWRVLAVPLFRRRNNQRVCSITHWLCVKLTPTDCAVFGETWRSKRAEGKRRDAVQDALEQNQADIERLQEMLNEEKQEREDALKREKELEKVVEEVRPLRVSLSTLGQLTRRADRVDWPARWFRRAA